MASSQSDRTQALVGNSAIKTPVRVATTTAITLSGTQTIDGVACVVDDRVLVKNQTSSIDNGIYIVDTGSWTRAPDWDGIYDVVQGTVVYVTQGSTGQGLYSVTTSGSIIPGTTSITIVLNTSSALTINYPRTAAEISASVTPTYYSFTPGDVRRYGAVGDASTDDLIAFQNALISNKLVYVPVTSTGYRLSAGLTILGGVTMYSDCFQPGNPPSGTKLIFDLNVATLMTIGGVSAANASGGAVGFSVTRAAGTIPAASQGIRIEDGYNITLRDMASYRSSINWNFVSAAPAGISSDGANLHSGAATDVHWQFDGWPEFRCNGGRTGMNGTGNFSTASYIRIQGGSGSGGSGPNTLSFVNHHFNQGDATAAYWIDFNHPANPSGNAVEYRFIGCHIEHLGTAGIFSDSSSTLINRFQMSNCNFNSTLVPFLALDAATQIDTWEISNNQIYSSTFTLAPTPQINSLVLHGNRFSGAVSITGPSGSSGSTASLQGNSYGNGVTYTGGDWGSLTVDGDFITAGSLVMTATGKISINLPGQYLSWTPGIAFGGGTTGITYSRQQGRLQYINNLIMAEYSIILTSKGSSTGNAAITGLPVASNAADFAAGPSSAPNIYNMTGLTGTVKVFVGQGLTTAGFSQSTAVGDVAINDTVFTNTTTIAGILMYPK